MKNQEKIQSGKGNSLYHRILRGLLLAAALLPVALSVAAQQIPVVTARFSNPQYDCYTQTYSVDVDFQSDVPNKRIFGVNLRYAYDSQVLQFIEAKNFASGYGLASTPAVTTGNAHSGAAFFGFSGPLTYWNGNLQLLNPYATPTPISPGAWTRILSLSFQVVDAGALLENTLSPCLVWEKKQNPEEGGFFGGSEGLVVTLLESLVPLKTSPTTEHVVQFNWSYTEEQESYFGYPAVTNALFFTPALCEGLDQNVNIAAAPVLLESALPSGGTYSGAGVSGSFFYPANAGMGQHRIYYTVPGDDGCPMHCSFVINVFGGTRLSGQVTYLNDLNTPLNDVTMQLRDNFNQVVATTSTNGITINSGNNTTTLEGYYAFENIPQGEYTLSASTSLPWYGANATDALALQLKIVGALPPGFIWDPSLSDKIADVNNSSSLTSLDALLIARRAIGLISSFTIGDWAFHNPTFTVAGETVVNIAGLNTGDVNRSNIPYQAKSSGGYQIVSNYEMPVNKEEIVVIPITLLDNATLGALTLALRYDNTLIEVLDVDFEVKNINHQRGQISFAWFDTEPRKINAGDIIALLKVKILKEIGSENQLFTIEPITEFANEKAIVLNNITLGMPKPITESAGMAAMKLSFHPNPFTDFTKITYTLPVSGDVTLKIFDQKGVAVSTLSMGYQMTGEYSFEFTYPGLKPGMYVCRLTLNDNTAVHTRSGSLIYIP